MEAKGLETEKIFTFQCSETRDEEIHKHIPLPHHSATLAGK